MGHGFQFAMLNYKRAMTCIYLQLPAYFLMRIDVNGGIHELDDIVVSNQT